jgi:hypothetical protein
MADQAQRIRDYWAGRGHPEVQVWVTTVTEKLPPVTGRRPVIITYDRICSSLRNGLPTRKEQEATAEK